MHQTKLTWQVVSSLAEFESLRPSWNHLASTNLFHRWEWMFSWWEAYRGEGLLVLVVVHDASGECLGIAPWYRTTASTIGQIIRNLGCGSACSDFVGVLMASQREAEVAEAIANAVETDAAFSGIDAFEMEGHTTDCPSIAALLRAFRSRGMVCHDEEIGGTWRTELDASWEQFNARLSKSFRRKTKKAMCRLGDSEFSARVISTSSEFGEIWPAFVALHQRRRESLGQPGCFADPHFEHFLQAAVGRLINGSLAQLHWIEYRQQPISGSLEFLAGDGSCMYQTGSEPQLQHLEPGHLIFTWAIQQAIERGCSWFDFLRGDEPYKARWNTARIPIFRTRVIPGRLSSRVRFGIWSTGQSVRNWAKTIVGS